MYIYQVRVFNENKWHVIRCYAIEEEAKSWANCLDTEWDIKKVTLEEANA
jgi:hypothetical protein